MKPKPLKRIRTLEELSELALCRKSVVVPASYPWRNPRPAAFVINLQGHIIVRLFDMGMFVYQTEKKGQQ